MPSLRCPRCGTTVQSTTAKPVCPSCGFGGPAPKAAAGQPSSGGARPAAPAITRAVTPIAVAPAARPMTPATAASAAPAPGFSVAGATSTSGSGGFVSRPSGQGATANTGAVAAKPGRRGKMVVVGIVGLLVVAGGAGAAYYFLLGGEDAGARIISAAEAPGFARDSLLAFSDAPTLRDVELNRIEVTGSMTGDEMMGEDVSIEASLEIGEDSTAIMVHFGAGAISYDIEKFCVDGRSVVVVGGKAYEEHPEMDPLACYDSLASLGGEEDDEMAEFSAMLSGVTLADLEEEGMENFTAKPRDGGGVTASYDDEEGLHVTVQIDGDGNLLEIKMSQEGVEFKAKYSYGAAAKIELPEPEGQNPAYLSCWGWADDEGVHEAECFGQGAYDLKDFEVRVVRDEQVRAKFPLGGPSRQTKSGYTFEFNDEDGDGALSSEDTFTVSGVDEFEDEVIVWDLFSDSDLDDAAVPSVGPLTVLGLLGAVAVALRRRIA